MSQLLIDELVEGLEPTRRSPGIGVSLALWTVASWASTLLLVTWTGPLRSGALGQLSEFPRFALECGVGLAVGVVAMAGALQIATPGRGRSSRLALPGLLLVAAWGAAYVHGLVSPALAPGDAGHRAVCLLEILLMSLPPLAFALLLLRRRAALEPGIALGLAAVAAASLPGLAMQFACKYEPLHTLQMHLSPMLLVGGVGLLLGRAVLRRI